jgi:CarboxypepD_reg-like domain/TonB dependent receptor
MKNLSIKFGLFLFFTFFILINPFVAQSMGFTQTIKGTVLDADSKEKLIFANILLKNNTDSMVVQTDELGDFKIQNVSIGASILGISYIGYETKVLQAMVNSGKQTVLNVLLKEKVEKLKGVLIQAARKSGRGTAFLSFKPNEILLLPATFDGNLGRAMQNRAGVTGVKDWSNEIVVRGNSPKGVLYRLEGIEIPSPNHFGNLGASGGGISMLSGSVLGNFDFYMGAFPATMGNAMSGVFDLTMRNGNSEKREHSIQAGVLGLELNTEGYFVKGGKSSYLFHYRYTTTGLVLKWVPPKIAALIPKYQDFACKINLPSDNGNGNIGFFALYGDNLSQRMAKADASKWVTSIDNENYQDANQTGIAGVTYSLPFNYEKNYLKFIAATTFTNGKSRLSILKPEKNYEAVLSQQSDMQLLDLKLNLIVNHKVNSQNTLCFGLDMARTNYAYQYSIFHLITKKAYMPFNNVGVSDLFQTFAQWKYRFDSNWTLNAGFHYTKLVLNQTQAIEPRFSLQYELSDGQLLGFNAGLHSRPEHLSVYFLESSVKWLKQTNNFNLKMPKAAHFVLNYEIPFWKDWRFRTETYYQYLYDIGVEKDGTRSLSMLNIAATKELFGAKPLVSTGTGQNLGIEMTLEKAFAKHYHVLLTGSLYDSKFRDEAGQQFNTIYNGRYGLNAVGGYEIVWGVRQHKSLIINGKWMLKGGNRYTPLDEVASKQLKREVLLTQQFLQAQSPAYWRVDASAAYQVNQAFRTHTYTIEIQNVMNHQNIYYQFYDLKTLSLQHTNHLGLLANLNYKLEF